MKRLSISLLTLTLLTACGEPTSGRSPYYGSRGADQSWPGSASADIKLAAHTNTVNYYVIFDGSGSMNEQECGDGQSRIQVAKQSIRMFFDALPKTSNVGMLIFDRKGLRDARPLEPNDPKALTSLTDHTRAGGNTPLAESLLYAYQQLTLQGKRQQGYGDYNIVVLTDGEANDTEKLINAVDTITAESPINIHTIGFCLDQHHALNQRGVVNYHSASNAAELIKGFDSVLAEAPSFDDNHFQDTNN